MNQRGLDVTDQLHGPKAVPRSVVEFEYNDVWRCLGVLEIPIEEFRVFRMWV